MIYFAKSRFIGGAPALWYSENALCREERCAEDNIPEEVFGEPHELGERLVCPLANVGHDTRITTKDPRNFSGRDLISCAWSVVGINPEIVPKLDLDKVSIGGENE
ncbi:MAG: hypothetical protein HYR55_07515 [Acidobacteria bacterium]|nr:hypothetical protein [Acidobacteriota bacterium]